MFKKILVITLFILVFVPLTGGILYYVLNATWNNFESVCEKGHKRYTPLCENVGKHAISQLSIINVTDKDYGQIVGVAWRRKGDIISSSNQNNRRYSEKNAYYYIVQPDKSTRSQFLRAASETDAR